MIPSIAEDIGLMALPGGVALTIGKNVLENGEGLENAITGKDSITGLDLSDEERLSQAGAAALGIGLSALPGLGKIAKAGKAAKAANSALDNTVEAMAKEGKLGKVPQYKETRLLSAAGETEPITKETKLLTEPGSTEVSTFERNLLPTEAETQPTISLEKSPEQLAPNKKAIEDAAAQYNDKLDKLNALKKSKRRAIRKNYTPLDEFPQEYRGLDKAIKQAESELAEADKNLAQTVNARPGVLESTKKGPSINAQKEVETTTKYNPPSNSLREEEVLQQEMPSINAQKKPATVQQLRYEEPSPQIANQYEGLGRVTSELDPVERLRVAGEEYRNIGQRAADYTTGGGAINPEEAVFLPRFGNIGKGVKAFAEGVGGRLPSGTIDRGLERTMKAATGTGKQAAVKAETQAVEGLNKQFIPGAAKAASMDTTALDFLKSAFNKIKKDPAKIAQLSAEEQQALRAYGRMANFGEAE